jgi:hypothetical protein
VRIVTLDSDVARGRVEVARSTPSSVAADASTLATRITLLVV